MAEINHEGSTFEILTAGVTPGAAALHGLKQLIRELEPVIGLDAAERVRQKIESNIRAADVPEELQNGFLHGLR